MYLSNRDFDVKSRGSKGALEVRLGLVLAFSPSGVFKSSATIWILESEVLGIRSIPSSDSGTNTRILSEPESRPALVLR